MKTSGPEPEQVLDLDPESHLAQAAEYLARAEQSVWRSPARGSDELPFVGEDAHLQRHVEVYTKLATTHLQFASTKSLLQATRASGGSIPPRKPGNTLHAQMERYVKCEQAYTSCGEYVGTGVFCQTVYPVDGECPNKEHHVTPSATKPPPANPTVWPESK